MRKNKIDLKRIIVFVVIAVACSNIFRFNIFGTKEYLQQLPAWIFLLLTALLEGSGVFIGALLAIYLIRKERKTCISFFGTSTIKSVTMLLIPMVLLTIIGVKNFYGINTHLYGFFAAGVSLIYCIMEELGWRGYLQEELKDLKPLQRYFIIGTIWYTWHLTFLTKATFSENLFFLAMMLLGSWGIGQVATLTKSVVASACFHMIIQIMMFNGLIKNGLTNSQKLMVLGTSVLFYILILNKWKYQHTKC